MSILSGLFAKYGDDIARKFVDHADDAVLAGIRNHTDDAIRAAANQTDDLAKLAMAKRANVPLNQRLTGDSLLNAQDLIDNIKSVGGTVDDFGNVRLYHRTTPESAQKIMDSGKMFGKEDGLFFSTAKNGVNNSAYGSTPVAFDIPAENLLLDDIFGDEASIRMPLQRAGQYADISDFINKPNKTALNTILSDDDIFYHGTPNGGFQQFNDGSYFTKNKSYADSYQNPLASDISFGKKADNPMTYQVKLHNKMPFDISDDAARKIYIDDYIKGGNATGINPYQPQSFYDNIKDIDWTEVEGLKDFLIDNGYGYDSIIANEGGYFDNLGNVVPRGQSVLMFNGKDVEIMPNTLSKITTDDEIIPLFRGQKYGTNDLLYNHKAGAGTSQSVGNAFYFTPNEKMTEPWADSGVIQIPARKSDFMTLDDLLARAKEADELFADPRAAQSLYNTNPTQYDLMEAIADRRYKDIAELTGKPFIQPDSGQGEELMETLFFPDVNPTLTDIYRELLRRSGGKPI